MEGYEVLMDKDVRFIDFCFDNVKKTSWLVVAWAVIVDAAILFVAMQVVLPLFRASFPLERLTNGLVQATLVFSVTRFVLTVVGVAMLLGRLGARDIGLKWDKMVRGALVVLGVWIAMQLVGMIIGLAATGKVALSPYWTPDRLLPIAGELIAQFLGNEFAEEVIFRGFLLTQVYLLLQPVILGRGRRLTASVFLSQLLFSLSHIPERIASGYTPLGMLFNLTIVWVWGILFAVLYLRTENLFVAVGVHAQANAPVTVLAMPSEGVAGLLPLALGLVLILIWGPGKRWVDRLGTRSQRSKSLTQESAS
jgi:membrane protease YdiL (CAAX protease family)